MIHSKERKGSNKETSKFSSPTSLPPPSSFSRHFSTNSLDVDELQRFGSSENCSSCSDILCENEREQRRMRVKQRERQNRVRARQEAEQLKTMAKSQRSQQRSCGSSISSNSTSAAKARLSSSAQRQSGQVKCPEAQQVREISAGQLQQEQAAENQVYDPTVEDKPWYLQTSQELLASEKKKDELERMRDHGRPKNSTTSSVASHMSLGGGDGDGDGDGLSCVSSLSGHTVETAALSVAPTKDKSAAKEKTYNVRSLKAKRAAPANPSHKKPPSATRTACPVDPKAPRNPTQHANQSRVRDANTSLLAGGGDITKKFLRKSEVEAHLSDVEEEIRLLSAKQVQSRAFIQSTLSVAEDTSAELKNTEETLSLIYDASLEAMQDRVRKQEVVQRFRSGADKEAHSTADEPTAKMSVRNITVDDLEKENTRRKAVELSQQPTSRSVEEEHKLSYSWRGSRTVTNPVSVMEKISRMDMLWGVLKEHARQVGRRQVCLKKCLPGHEE